MILKAIDEVGWSLSLITRIQQVMYRDDSICVAKVADRLRILLATEKMLNSVGQLSLSSSQARDGLLHLGILLQDRLKKLLVDL